MLFMIHGIDKKDADGIREANGKKHREYVAKFKNSLICAGPTLSDDGETKTGTIIMIDMDDKDRVESFVKNDPYVKAGLFETLTIQPWRRIDGGDI